MRRIHLTDPTSGKKIKIIRIPALPAAEIIGPAPLFKRAWKTPDDIEE